MNNKIKKESERRLESKWLWAVQFGKRIGLLKKVKPCYAEFLLGWVTKPRVAIRWNCTIRFCECNFSFVKKKNKKTHNYKLIPNAKTLYDYFINDINRKRSRGGSDGRSFLMPFFLIRKLFFSKFLHKIFVTNLPEITSLENFPLLDFQSIIIPNYDV